MAQGGGRRGAARQTIPPGQPGSSGVREVGRALTLRGRMRLALIRDLAMGEWSHAEIARSIGATTKEIAAFADDHTQEIAEVSAALAGRLALETAGLWISRKQNRVAELQAAYDDNDAVIQRMRDPSALPGQDLGSKRHYNLQRMQLAILSAAAQEYEPRRGTPAATSDDAKVVHYIIEGPETDALT